MSDQPSPSAVDVPTIDGALANAARLLYAAEVETDRQLMERLEHLADSWINLAGLLVHRAKD